MSQRIRIEPKLMRNQSSNNNKKVVEKLNHTYEIHRCKQTVKQTSAITTSWKLKIETNNKSQHKRKNRRNKPFGKRSTATPEQKNIHQLQSNIFVLLLFVYACWVLGCITITRHGVYIIILCVCICAKGENKANDSEANCVRCQCFIIKTVRAESGRRRERERERKWDRKQKKRNVQKLP